MGEKYNSMSGRSPKVIKSDDTEVSTLDEGAGAEKVTLATPLDNGNDSITAFPADTIYVNLTASGKILAGPGKIIGFYVNSTNVGTIRFSDALTATTPYLGAAITPAIGWHKFPFALGTGGYATIGGTALDVTVAVIAD